MIVVSTLIVGQVICGLDKPMVENMLLFVRLNNCDIPAESSFESSKVSFKRTCTLSLISYNTVVSIEYK